MASNFNLDLPHEVRFQSNLPAVLRLQREASEEAVKAAAKVVESYAKNVRLAKGFKGETDPPPKTDNITSLLDESEDVPTAKVGMPEKGAPERPFFVWWETSHWNEITQQMERERWLTDSLEKTRSQQAESASRAAQEVLDGGKGIPSVRSVRGFTTGFGTFGVVSFFT